MNNSIDTLISVVIPNYNHGSYLSKAIKSLLNQTHKNWEAFIVDNHSTDNSDEIINSFSDTRIKYLKIHNNGVIAISRNVGINASRGEWIAFLDSDDYWTKDKLEVCLSHTNNQVDLVYHDLEIKYNQKNIFKKNKTKTRQLKKPILIDLLVNGNLISNSSVFVRRNLLKNVNGINESKEMVAAEDYNTWLKIAKLTDQFTYIPKKLGYYLVDNQSMSKRDMSLPTRYAVAEFENVLNHKQKINLKANLKYASGRFSYLNNDFKKAKKDLFFVFKNGSKFLKVRAIYMILIMFLK